MAQLGFRTIDEMIGRSDLLDMKRAIDHYKAQGLDFSKIFYRPDGRPRTSPSAGCVEQDHGLDKALDQTTLAPAGRAGARARRAGRARAADPQRQPDRRHDPRQRADPQVRRRGPARRHDQDQVHRLGRPELRRLRARGG